jgi:hypothetical protein
MPDFEHLDHVLVNKGQGERYGRIVKKLNAGSYIVEFMDNKTRGTFEADRIRLASCEEQIKLGYTRYDEEPVTDPEFLVNYPCLKAEASSFSGNCDSLGLRPADRLTLPPLAVAGAPPAKILNPSSRILMAALTSLSWCVPQWPHCQARTLSGILS